MKKRTALLLCFILIFSFISCRPDPDGPFIPSISDDLTPTPEYSAPQTSDLSDEESYYSSLGVIILQPGDDISSFYAMKTYDGAYSYLFDCIFRLRLDLEALQSLGYDDGTYKRYSELCAEFIGDRLPYCLHPGSDLTENPKLSAGKWQSAFMILYDLDESRTLANEKLIDLYRFECRRRMAAGGDAIKGISGMPRLTAAIFPETPKVEGQHYDSDTGMTVIEAAPFGEGGIIYTTASTEIRGRSGEFYIASPGEKITLMPDYSGTISLAAIGKDGVIGETVHFNVKQETGSITADPVNLRSTRLDAAVRSHLGKSAGDVLTRHDLIAINEIFITGDRIFINGEGVTAEVMNLKKQAEYDDFDFSDLDFFPCLHALTVCHNRTGAPRGAGVCRVERLWLQNCGIEDISGLEASRASVIWLADNKITDASVLENIRSATDISLAGNPLASLSLPDRCLSTLVLRSTGIHSIDFLSDLPGLFSLDLSDTEITDFSVLRRFGALDSDKTLSDLSLPGAANADEIILWLPRLRSLSVGERQVK